MRARPGLADLALLALAVAALALAPAVGASPTNDPHPGVAAPPTQGVWAWGALENVSDQAVFVGAYADALGLAGGNLSGSLGYLVEVAETHALYEAYTVVNATSPTNTTRSVEAVSVSEVNYTGYVIVNGTLPAVGTYAPGAAAKLINVTAIYYVTLLEVDVYVVYANYTWSGANLSLANEHVQAWELYNETVILYHWPSYVINPNGSTTITSTTYASVALSWVAESIQSTFTPALPIAEEPLSVGETWNATTSGAMSGWEDYESAAAYSSGGTNSSSLASGGDSLNTTVTLAFAFNVTGSEEVVFPNGTTATGYVVQASVSGGTSSGYTLWDGLAVLPSAAVPGAPVAAPSDLRADAPWSSASPASVSEAVVESGFPVATESPVSATANLDTAPLSAPLAQSEIAGTAAPAAPTEVRAPSVTGPPTGSETSKGSSTGSSSSGGSGSTGSTGTSGSSGSTTTPGSSSSNPPATNPGSTSPGSSTPVAPPPAIPTKKAVAEVSPWLVAGMLAAIAVGFLAIEASRRRRTL